MKENPLILTGQDPRLTAKINRLASQQQRKANKQARETAKQEKQAKERLKSMPVKSVATVRHQPQYCVYSYKRLQDINDPSFQSKNFRPTPTFVAKSEVQSFKSQSRLKNAIGWMLLFADKKRIYSKVPKIIKGKEKHNFYFRLAFITLTLPDAQKHTDEYIKEHMLQPFLYWLNRYYNSLYVWKAESQLNGNIHFHLTIDTFVHWRSIRAKWNNICAKHSYCKVFQDGTNDKGNAATQIKAVLSENTCARDMGGYMSKKDFLSPQIKKAFEQLDRGELTYTETIKKAFEVITHHKTKGATQAQMLSTVTAAKSDAVLHCKFDPDKTTKEQDTEWYKRVISGRLWGCSENLSGINIFLDETDTYFEKEEKIFFRKNDNIYNLGTKVIEREKRRHAKKPERDRELLRLTDDDIEHKYRFMKNVFIHPHLATMKKGAELQRIIHEQKLSRQKNFQKFFTVESLN